MTDVKPQGIYLDNNATTRVDPRVVEAMLPFFTEQFGNPSSIHSFGADVGKTVRWARDQVKTLLGAEHDSEIVFTSGGTESDNAAILSALTTQKGRDEIITSAVEHPAVLALCEYLAKHEGYTLHVIPVDSLGRLDVNAYDKALSENTAIVSFMWANNETGTIFPISRLAAMAKKVGALFHTDAVQIVGKMPLNVAATEIDFLSLSGHKLHGPKGIGALYVRRGTRLRPIIRGGHQERDRRAGTENVTGIVGLGKACELAMEYMEHENIAVKALRDKLEQGILAKVSHCFVTGDPADRLPNTCNIAFEYIEGEAILLFLNRLGIAASSGSACTSGSLEPSHVMRAMNVPFTAAHGATRFSLSRETTEAEIDAVIDAVPAIIEKLRALSPFWDKDTPKAEAFDPAYA
ncbi:cysteine desulfurase NifS [Caenispirillum salinarum]|uniref:cysteine desulfurase NifS n=1 Tax=Caenispirillum salinarum TaxID=859058 RepID=UPI00384DC9CB